MNFIRSSLLIFIISTVDLAKCSAYFTVDGLTCTATEEMPGKWERVSINVPSLDSDGCYTVSLICPNKRQVVIVGFRINDILGSPRKGVETQAYIFLDADDSDKGGLGYRLSTMNRAIGDSTLTLMYHPIKGTLHGQYDLEPAILLRHCIPNKKEAQLQPFVEMFRRGTQITIVDRPRPVIQS